MSDYSDLITTTPGLVAYWRLGEVSGNALDTSGNGYTGTVVGATYGVTGLIDADPNPAYDFDGTNDNVSFGDVLDFEHNAPFTFECRLSLDSFGGGGTDRSILAKVNVAGAGEPGWEVRFSTHQYPRLVAFPQRLVDEVERFMGVDAHVGVGVVLVLGQGEGSHGWSPVLPDAVCS